MFSSQVSQRFRKSSKNSDNEPRFKDKNGDFWVQVDDIMKNYQGRPVSAEPLLVSQIGAHFK